jgi:hypothetical protein
MTVPTQPYAARLDVDYPKTVDRVSTGFRIFWIIPIGIVLGALSAAATSTITEITDTGQVVTQVSRTGGGIAGGLFTATPLMILFRRQLDLHQTTFAMGESVAHLHLLWLDGRLVRTLGDDGIYRFTPP